MELWLPTSSQIRPLFQAEYLKKKKKQQTIIWSLMETEWTDLFNITEKFCEAFSLKDTIPQITAHYHKAIFFSSGLCLICDWLC